MSKGSIKLGEFEGEMSHAILPVSGGLLAILGVALLVDISLQSLSVFTWSSSLSLPSPFMSLIRTLLLDLGPSLSMSPQVS